MEIAVTGATGFIGRRLVRRLLASGHSVRILGRRPPPLSPGQGRFYPWDALGGPPPPESLEGADAVVNLAGEPVTRRWTNEVKVRIRESRAGALRRMGGALAGLRRRPGILVSASAIGFYGPRGDETLEESSPPGNDFLAQTCVEWEEEALAAGKLGLRVAVLRTGIALGPDGGALARMLPPFKAGTGGRLGNGKQWMSWIHAEDLVDLYVFALEHASLRGPVNATSPGPVTNADFTSALASALRRPALFPVPPFALRWVFGEAAGVLLASQRVLPAAAEAAGFRFRYPSLGPALRDLLA